MFLFNLIVLSHISTVSVIARTGLLCWSEVSEFATLTMKQHSIQHTHDLGYARVFFYLSVLP